MRSARDVLHSYYAPEIFATIALAVLFTLLSIHTPTFFSLSNVINVLRQVSLNAILACGMSFAILSGGIDLSVGSVVAFTGVVTASLVKDPVAAGTAGIAVAVIAGILAGTFFGLFNGMIVGYTKIPPFIATFASMSVARGAAYVYTNGYPISGLSSDFTVIGKGYIGGIPIPVVIMAFVVLASWILLNRTRFGRYTCAIGGNVETVRLAGVKVRRIYACIYTLVGFYAAIAGVTQCARLSSGQPTAGINWELDAIASVVVGGGNIAGGRVTIFGTIIGALIIGVINTGLNMLGVLPYLQLVVKGFVIIVAVLLRSGLNRES